LLNHAKLSHGRRRGTTNRFLLENYYLPGDLEAQLDAFVEHYNQRRYHDSLRNLTPADVYFGRGQTILLEHERIKRNTLQRRRLMHHRLAAEPQTQVRLTLSLAANSICLKAFDGGPNVMNLLG
jgi:hypothetical protein